MHYAFVAQRIERRPPKPKVGGSIPPERRSLESSFEFIINQIINNLNYVFHFVKKNRIMFT